MTARRRFTAWVALPLGIIVGASIVVTNAGAADPLAGSQGIDTSLPATDSQVTVNGRGKFADLAITVNQTDNLTNQAVSITWEGGTPTTRGPGTFAGNYMQIMQCWGDDDGTFADNPGPAPEQCVQGATAGTFGGRDAGGLYPPGFALGRVISRSTWANFDPEVGVLDDRTTNVWLPFRAVDGTEVDIQSDPTYNPSAGGGNFWLNPFFSIITTNEIAAAATGPDGTGAELMQVLTGVQSSGLGCGQRVQPVGDGTRRIPQCWIVVVPRGNPIDENAGTPGEIDADQKGVTTSPVSPAAWQNRIAIPIGFNPVDSPCSIADEDRRISGTELALGAVTSWQPALCAGGGLPPFTYSAIGDPTARQQFVAGAAGAPGMIAVSRPIAASSVDPADPVVYAPLTLSGLVIGFNVERYPSPAAPEEAQQLAGVRIADLNLTPRLVAKLLTQSYGAQLEIVERPDYAWLADNPPHLGQDPDFIQFNPEFAQLLVANSRTFSGLELPAGNSDAARQVWEWVLADPEARAWLDGAPDEWGMRVNPVYATTAAANSNGASFADPVPGSFPKADPFCYQSPPRGIGNSVVPPPLCSTEWMPYARTFADAAQVTRLASDGARIVENPNARAPSEVWTRELPQLIGRRAMLSLTDTASASQYGLQVARLSRAGDNGAGRAFVAPNQQTLTAGVDSFAVGAEPQVLEPSPAATTAGAYPLTVLTYAAIAPLGLDDTARSDYASFIEYAADAGQEPGFEPGQLPGGYASLPLELRIQALFSAVIVRLLEPAPETPPPPTTTVEPTAPTSSTTVPIATSVVTPTQEVEAPSAGGFPSGSQSGSGSSGSSSRGSSTAAAPVIEAPAVEEVAVVEETTATVEVEALDEVNPEQESSVPSLITPILAIGRSRYAVPGLGVVALASMLGALEVTKRPRRRLEAEAVEMGNDPGVGELPDAALVEA